MEESGPTRVHDPRVLRGIAHPVRNRILAELTATGSMRAADVARELDLPANQASFHLRQLAKYGLVEEDPAAARDKRDRVWKAVNADGLNIDLSELEKQPGGKAAATVFRRSGADWAHTVVDAAYAGAGRDHDQEVHRSISESALRLTAEEAAELSRELSDVASAWTERTRGRDDAERRTYSLLWVLQVYPELLAPRSEADR